VEEPPVLKLPKKDSTLLRQLLSRHKAGSLSCAMVEYAPGDFSFVRCKYFREALTYDYGIVCENDLWYYFKNISENSILRFDNMLNSISWYEGHSGCSFETSMTNMKIIAKKGWDKLVSLHMRR
jgi:hypothetical protein